MSTAQPRQFTDEELDRDWKPNGRRPQSTVARSFSAELMDIFKIDDSVADLDEKVDRRKQAVSMQTSELQSLEARLREMEDKLNSAPDPNGESSAPNSPPRGQRKSVTDANDAPSQPQAPKDDLEQSKRAPAMLHLVEKGGRRPVGGYMPPTPGLSEDGDRE